MRSITAAILVTLLGAIPLVAQLTPAQRQEREAKELRLNYSRIRADRMEARALAGDVSAYGGPSAWGERPYWDSRGRWGYLYSRMRGPIGAPIGVPMGAPIHWASLSAAPQHANTLRPLTTARLNANAGTPTVLTLASPIGGPERTLMVRTAVAGADGEEEWARMGEMTADAEGRYLIPIPSLRPGIYTLQVEVFDPDRPAAPYSTSSNTLRVQ